MAPTIEIMLAVNATTSEMARGGIAGSEMPVTPGVGVGAAHGWLGVGVHGTDVGAAVADGNALGVAVEKSGTWLVT
jgi:hypothetical protein